MHLGTLFKLNAGLLWQAKCSYAGSYSGLGRWHGERCVPLFPHVLSTHESCPAPSYLLPLEQLFNENNSSGGGWEKEDFSHPKGISFPWSQFGSRVCAWVPAYAWVMWLHLVGNQMWRILCFKDWKTVLKVMCTLTLHLFESNPKS